MKKLLSITCLLIASHTVRADDTKATASAKGSPVVDVTPASGSGSGSYVPKQKSTFTAGLNAHNPFWPIGWVKTESISTADNGASLTPRPEDFSVTTIMLNEPPMAVINSKDMAEGEVAALNVNGRSVIVQLMAVQDGRVILRWQNQNLVVPIHRDEELSVAAPEQPATDLR